MCKRHLRKIKTTDYIKYIVTMECIYWSIMVCLVSILYYTKDDDEIFTEYVEQGLFSNNQDKAVVSALFNSELEEWKTGLILHSVLAFLFIPLSTLLVTAVRHKARSPLIVWIVLSICLSISRLLLFTVVLSRSYKILKWFEFYWVCRVYFLLVAGSYALELWNEEENAIPLDLPLLVYPNEGTHRAGNFGYPEFPLSLDQRERIYGVGRHLPHHMDWRFINQELPTWYDAKDQHGHNVLVLGSPPYEPDV